MNEKIITTLDIDEIKKCNYFVDSYMSQLDPEKNFMYMAGPHDCDKYRDRVQKSLRRKFNVFNPITVIDEEYLNPKNNKLSDDDIKKMIYLDHAFICISDIMVAYVPRFTCGTLMEIKFAFDSGVFVAVISEDEKIRADFWLKNHTMLMFKSCGEFIDILQQTI